MEASGSPEDYSDTGYAGGISNDGLAARCYLDRRF